MEIDARRADVFGGAWYLVGGTVAAANALRALSVEGYEAEGAATDQEGAYYRPSGDRSPDRCPD
ncbi:MAG: hypothetical protein JWM95_1706 [Gemmatimonadetes bacterium]|nr:hypothetical protein [Gemmatimonadota bacterium]